MATATATERGENRVHILKDHIQRMSNETRTQFILTPKAITLSCWEPSESTRGTALSIFINKMKTLKSDLRLLITTVHYPRRIFQVVFTKLFLESLYRMLPRPFVQFKGVVEEVTPDGLTRKVNDFGKRFDIQDLLEADRKDGKQAFDQYFSAAGRCGNGNCTFSIIVGWTTPPDHSIQLSPESLTQSLFENEPTKDLILVAGNGAELKCHKIIFGAQSAVLTAMVYSDGMRESELGRVDLREYSELGIGLLLRYLYGFKLVTKDISCDLMVELFQVAHKYDLAQLESSLIGFLLKRDEKWFTPDAILELYFYARNVKEFETLSNHALLLTTRIQTQVFRSCEGFKKLDPAAASEFLGEQVNLFQKGIAK